MDGHTQRNGADGRLRVVVTRKLPEPVERRLAELFDARLNETDEPMSREGLVAAMRSADILVPTLTDRIDNALLAQAGEQLRLIANYGAGVDHIDVATARSRGVLVTNTPGVLAEDSADITMALILAVPRRLADGMKMMADGAWGGWSPTHLLGSRVSGKRLGVLGMGAVGQAVARAPRRRLESRSTITSARHCRSSARRSWAFAIGIVSIRCWRAWTSFPSIARIRRRPSIC